MNIHLKRRRTRRLNPKSFKTQNLRSFSHLHRSTTRGCVPYRCGKNSLAAEDAKGASRVCRSVGHSHSSHWRRPEDERTKKASHSPPLSLSLFSSRMALNFGGVSRWPKNRVAVFPHGLDTRDAGGSSTSSTNHRAKRALLTGYLLGSP